MTSTKEEPILVWLDLETTGIEPRDGEVLEVAAFATDVDGVDLPEVKPFEAIFQYRREAILSKMDDFVLKMHFDSDLLPKVWAGDVTPNDVINSQNRDKWTDLCNWFYRLPGKAYKRYLAGNSIHFDRGWLKFKRNEVLDGTVSHRMLDVSSFLIVQPEFRMKDGDVAHRAMADAQQSRKTYVDQIVPLLRPKKVNL